MAEPESPSPTDVDYTDPRIGIYVPVPHGSTEGTCAVCHGATLKRDDGAFYESCWNCLGIPAGGTRLVVPISLVHTEESQLYAIARDYKSPYVRPEVRTRHTIVLASTLQRFLRLHEDCIAAASGGSWDTVTIVPSTRSGRVGPHPLEVVLGFSTTLGPQYRPLLSPTGKAIDRRTANPAAFAALPVAKGANVLIIDDTLTAGTSIQSAAAALTAGGARVVGAVAIGRLVDTGKPEKLEFWRRQSATPFDFHTCCLE